MTQPSYTSQAQMERFIGPANPLAWSKALTIITLHRHKLSQAMLLQRQANWGKCKAVGGELLSNICLRASKSLLKVRGCLGSDPAPLPLVFLDLAGPSPAESEPISLLASWLMAFIPEALASTVPTPLASPQRENLSFSFQQGWLFFTHFVYFVQPATHCLCYGESSSNHFEVTGYVPRNVPVNAQSRSSPPGLIRWNGST